MRIRSTHPDFWTDSVTGPMSAEVSLLYVGLWSVADDAGRMEWDPLRFAAMLDPYGAKFGGQAGMRSCLDHLVELGRLVPYAVGGRPYAFIPAFKRHQHPNKPTPSRLPEPPQLGRDYGRTPVALREDSRAEGRGREGRGGSDLDANASASKPANTTHLKAKEAEASRRDDHDQDGDGSDKDGRETSSAAGPLDNSPVVTVLPCSGTGPAVFEVTEALVAGWSGAFPDLAIHTEIAKAKVWLEANPKKQKTHRGTPRFLVNWLSRAQGDARARGASPVHPLPREHLVEIEPGRLRIEGGR